MYFLLNIILQKTRSISHNEACVIGALVSGYCGKQAHHSQRDFDFEVDNQYKFESFSESLPDTCSIREGGNIQPREINEIRMTQITIYI
jgi:hypothetical protein